MLSRSLYLAACCLAICFSLFTEEIKPDLTLMVPMRDGTGLLTDLYLPHANATNLPCILLRGPAGRHSITATCFINLAQAGYVVAIQDTRCAKDKEGKTLPFYSDGWGVYQDGYDAVQWLAKHPITNGKIGTLGLSNMGITQLLMAPTAPPALKCQYIGVATPSLFHYAIFPGGQLLKNQVEGWLQLVARDPAVLKFVTDQADNVTFWDEFNANKKARTVNVPAIHQGGWYDTFIQGTIDAYMARQADGGPEAKGKQKLVIGPWSHRWPIVTKLGDFPTPKEGYAPPIDLGPLPWFEYYLKDVSNQIDQLPSVIYYVMGPFDGTPSSGNVWRTSDVWPIPHQDTPFYLSGDHSLIANQAPKNDVTITFTHSNNNPVPTIGGRNLFLESGPMDQRDIEKRPDVMIFTTDPLTGDIEVTGRITAKMVFSSDAEDTDIAVRLTDVYPDGRSILIADALTRARNVKPFVDNEQKKEVDVDLWSTSIVFAKGHRIRVSITGSNYPRYEKNLAFARKNNHQVTYHLHTGGNHPSRLILPIVKTEVRNP